MAVERVGGGQINWLANHVARTAGRHFTSYRLSRSVELPHGSINTPLPVKVDTQTHHILGIPLAKHSFLV
jgi:hypothetical protein